MKHTKKKILSSVLALTLCLSMLLGSTFAWFTDSVSSTGNKIQSGNLEVDLQLLDKNGNWSSLKEDNDPIWDAESNKHWEPGYTDVKIFKVVNQGNLSLKWKAAFTSESELSILADVIDVYVKAWGVLTDDAADQSVTYPADRDLSGYTHVGTLRKFVNSIESTTYGSLEKGESAYLAIALKMQEGAGNDYKNKTIGSFDIHIVATQKMSESDSFGDTYDENAQFPLTPGKLSSASAPVTVNNEGKVENDVKIGSDVDKGTAIVPAGVKLDDGTTEVVLDVSVVKERQAVVEMKGGDVVIPLDVHVAGVSDDNTVPVIVTLSDIFPKNYASYNIKLFHVENGNTVSMTCVNSLSELDTHNEYYYDPATGDVMLAMATFSEVTATVASGNPWNGTDVDTSWYNTTDTEFTLYDTADLAGFAQIVGGMADGIERDSFVGKTVKLDADMNMGNNIFEPIGYYFTNDKNANQTPNESKDDVYSDVYSFEGIFDGQKHTISNIYQNTWEIKGDHPWYDCSVEGTQYYNSGMGLFGFVFNGTVKNLIIDNFQSDGEICTTGCVAAYASGTSTFENITILNSNPRAYNVPNGGVVGYAYAEKDATNVINFTNVKVDNSNKISALWGTYDAGCGGILGRVNGATTVNMTDCEVGAVLDVYNDVCGNYQYYQYRYSGMLIGTVGGDSNPLTGDETVKFTNVNVYIGDWADYYYCEFEKNSGASYTDDFQFSRVERNEIVFDENNMPTSCTHTHTVNEDKMALYLPFNQLYTGYGWGSSPQREADGVTVTRYFYMITYLDADGTLIAVEYVTDGQRDDTHNIANEKTIDKTHTATGKSFDGWVNLAATKVTSVAAGNRKDITLYATYANVYTARYVDEDGNVIQSFEVSKKSDLSTEVAGPASATDGLTFDHWEIRNSDKTYTKLDEYVKSNEDLTADVTVYPYYIYNGGTGTVALQGHDDDGDGRYDRYTVEAAAGLEGDVTIPGEVNGVPVTVITDLSSDFLNGSITSVVIEDGVTTINANAFAMTSGLKEVVIPTSVTSVGANAFSSDAGSYIMKTVEITYAGTWEQWQAACNTETSTDTGWDNGLSDGSKVICTDGTYVLKADGEGGLWGTYGDGAHEWDDWVPQQ